MSSIVKIFSITLFFGLSVFAATPAETGSTSNAESATVTTAVKPAAGKSTTGKSHNFEDLLISGKYHFADEAVSTVEADKVFDSLIGVRTDFKDRLEESASNK